MHDRVRQWVRRCADGRRFERVIEFGAHNINGTIRDDIDHAEWVGVDPVEGPGVDEVGDGATWVGEPGDLVVSTEVFEHCEHWRDIVANAFAVLSPGGELIVTAAGPGRAPHSGRRESDPDMDEFYRNVEPGELEAAMVAAGFVDVVVDQSGADVRGHGRKAEAT